MAKILFVFSLLLIVFVLFQEKKEPSKVEAPLPKATPIVSDPSPTPGIDVKKEVESLPVDENLVEDIKPPPVKKGLASLSLIATIYGVKEPVAMLADRNQKTFSVKLNEKILKSDYRIIRIEKDRIFVKKDGKTYTLKMKKKN